MAGTIPGLPAQRGANPVSVRSRVGGRGRQALSLGAALRLELADVLALGGELAGAGRQRRPVRARPLRQPPAEPAGRDDHGGAEAEGGAIAVALDGPEHVCARPSGGMERAEG